MVTTNTNKTFIIAEAGVNHNGSIGLALQLIEAAKTVGADAVKFQSFKADKLVSKIAKKAEYQLKTTSCEESHYEMIRRLELDENAHKTIIDHCKKTGILFLSSPFDEESADMLDKLGMELFKIPSGEITNKPFLQHVAGKNKPIILSTGMSTLEEVKKAVTWMRSKNSCELTLLHCVTEYPAPVDQINLRAIDTLREALNVSIGYSDHTEGNEIAIAAVARGSVVIEKHFTLDRTLPGPDHKASLEPLEFKEMVRSIRNVEQALGDGRKVPALCEMTNKDVARKSIVAARDLSPNHVIQRRDLLIKRPGFGISPEQLDDVIGKTVSRLVPMDQVVLWDYLK